MWDLIPVLDCSQLLKLCPSQCKLLICPTTTSGAWVDSARRTMSGKSRRCSERPPRHRNTAAAEWAERCCAAYSRKCMANLIRVARNITVCLQWGLISVHFMRCKRQVARAFPDRCSGLDRCKVRAQRKEHIRFELSKSTSLLFSAKCNPEYTYTWLCL